MENEIRDFLEFNGNEYATCTILINTKKINVVRKRKFIYHKCLHIGNLRAQFKVSKRKKVNEQL